MSESVTIERLVNAYNALAKLGQREGLKAAPSWWISRTLAAWKPDAILYDERRMELFKKYGEATKMAEGERYEVPPAKLADFNAEFLPLTQEIVEVSVTKHAVEWLGAGIEQAIEPEILFRVGDLMFERPAVSEDTTATLTRRDVDALYYCLEAGRTYRMPSGLGWWVVDLSAQVAGIVNETNLKRTACAGDEKALIAMLKEKVEIKFTPRPFSDLGDLTERWTPAMLSALMFAFTEPVEPVAA